MSRWTRSRAWAYSSAAATWITGAYDPDLNLVYWGTGNPGPDFLGDDRKGDNLYSDAVVALDADTGELRWHFQFTPHDLHDMDACQVPLLLDAEFDGAPRKLLLFPNRNGFYYILDRETGEFLLGREFAKQNWALRLDENGRPVEGAQIRVQPGWRRATTGNDGRFKVSGFDEVELTVQLTESGRGFIQGEAVKLPAGENSVRLVAVVGKSIKGKVVAPDGKPTNMVSIQAIDENGKSVANTWVGDLSGEFELRGVPPGTYTLRLTRWTLPAGSSTRWWWVKNTMVLPRTFSRCCSVTRN